MNEYHNLKIVLILTFGFGFASLLGYITYRMKLSPLFGYLIAGYLIGPFSPGFVADLALSEQLAELGVILMMFGLGLHFNWRDLVKVKNIAIPGAIGQTLVTLIIGTLLIYSLGWGLNAGLVFGLAIAIASTVVLVRMLTEHNLLDTLQGHITVGWLIVEDIFTILALVLLPIVANSENVLSFKEAVFSFTIILLKFAALILILFTFVKKLILYAFIHVARTRSHELFTITLLALTFIIAVGSAILFGTSIALGAFLAGMIIGQTDLHHQAATFASPIKDLFSVIFFLAVGMLFNPNAIFNYPVVFLLTLFIILVIKPLVAFGIVIAAKYPIKTALTVGIALAQIGEFSFILAEEASRYNILPDAGYDIIVACALVSIPFNPLFFKSIDIFNKIFTSKPNMDESIIHAKPSLPTFKRALVIGYGPIGQEICKELDSFGYVPLVIDRNIDAISQLKKGHREGIYGDATHPEILERAKITTASLLIVTIPKFKSILNIIKSAQSLNSEIPIIARTHSITDIPILESLKVNAICEEKEISKALNSVLFNVIQQIPDENTP